MENNRQLGSEMEQMAAEYLESMGLKVIECNYRFHRNEIDLVCVDGIYYVFVEVKFRSTYRKGYPEEAVTPQKQKIIRKVALQYLVSHDLSEYTPTRFDVIAISGSGLKWYRNAF